MDQQVKSPDAKPVDLSSIWGTHIVEEENWTLQVFLGHTHTYTHQGSALPQKSK